MVCYNIDQGVIKFMQYLCVYNNSTKKTLYIIKPFIKNDVKQNLYKTK